jgi:hypothetical protein
MDVADQLIDRATAEGLQADARREVLVKYSGLPGSGTAASSGESRYFAFAVAGRPAYGYFMFGGRRLASGRRCPSHPRAAGVTGGPYAVGRIAHPRGHWAVLPGRLRSIRTYDAQILATFASM